MGSGLRQHEHVRCERKALADDFWALGRRNSAAEKMEPRRRDRTGMRATQATQAPQAEGHTQGCPRTRLFTGFWGLTDGAWTAQTTQSVPSLRHGAAYGIPPPTLVPPPLHTLNSQFYQSTITAQLDTAPTSEQSLLC